MSVGNGFIVDSQNLFHLSKEFIDLYVKKRSNFFEISECGEVLHRYFLSFMSTLYAMRFNEKYRMCDEHTVNPQFDEYLANNFLTRIGINVYDHDIGYIERVITVLIHELLDFYQSNPTEVRGVGRILVENRAMYLIVDPHIEDVKDTASKQRKGERNNVIVLDRIT